MQTTHIPRHVVYECDDQKVGIGGNLFRILRRACDDSLFISLQSAVALESLSFPEPFVYISQLPQERPINPVHGRSDFRWVGTIRSFWLPWVGQIRKALHDCTFDYTDKIPRH
jgi:hypothetical protein